MTSERVWTLTLGPEHPAGHGPLAFRLQVDSDEVVTWAEPLIHPLHRGVEKLFESRDYRQALMLADRHDWHSAFGSELGLALTIESALGIAVPPRATLIRTLMAELVRSIHHLRWLGESAWELSRDESLRIAARTVRERLTLAHEAISGGRIHPMLVQIGGLRSDAPSDWTVDVAPALAVCDRLAEWAESLVALAAVGVLPSRDALEFAVSGPVGRASALALDLRFDDPYCAYPSLISEGILTRSIRSAGGAQARFEVLAEELRVSLHCVEFCLGLLPETAGEPVNVRLPRTLRVPEGDAYGWTENPTGINGWYLVSRGGPEPYRLKVRTASYANAQALSHILPGTLVSQLPAALMSFLLVSGDLAK